MQAPLFYNKEHYIRSRASEGKICPYMWQWWIPKCSCLSDHAYNFSWLFLPGSPPPVDKLVASFTLQLFFPIVFFFRVKNACGLWRHFLLNYIIKLTCCLKWKGIDLYPAYGAGEWILLLMAYIKGVWWSYLASSLWLSHKTHTDLLSPVRGEVEDKWDR